VLLVGFCSELKEQPWILVILISSSSVIEDFFTGRKEGSSPSYWVISHDLFCWDEMDFGFSFNFPFLFLLQLSFSLFLSLSPPSCSHLKVSHLFFSMVASPLLPSL